MSARPMANAPNGGHGARGGARGSISGISTRRSACDKCRFSKARCTRKTDHQARCDRCCRADSECITSPIFRLRNWQPPTAVPVDPHVDQVFFSRSSRQANKRQRPSIRSSSSSTSRQLPTPREPESDSIMVLHLDPQHELEQDTPSPTTHVQPPFTNDEGLIHFVSSSREDIPRDWPTQSMSPLSNLSSSGHLYESGAGESMDGNIMTSFNNVESIFDMNLLHDLFPPTNAPTPPTQTDVAAPEELAVVHHALPVPADDQTEIGPTCPQRLSKLDYELITMLNQLGQESSPKPDMKWLVMPANPSSSQSVAHQILDKTTEFIDVIGLMANIHPPPPPSTTCIPPAAAPSNKLSSRVSHGGSRDAHISLSPFSDYEDEDSITSSPTTDYVDYAVNNDTPHGPPAAQQQHELDTPSLLMVMIAYMRLVQLYLIVFANVNGHLKELSQSDDPHLGPVPGLAFSNFPMQSGNLQTLILIQIVTNLFEKMDDLLALPREFRMSSRRRRRPQGVRQGLLDQAPGFSGIARRLLEREESAGSNMSWDGGTTNQRAEGSGGMKALRKHIVETKQLLRDCIPP
ncbi:hypothetical protein B0H66DRAFT_640050 [Apodospora peruviana]|uniref:Zn(2)-C6 fungal-type domain-containing protein n=1 Tax=Apodospora peruviana TaxID=516989 RepID=A0AAE0I531_9PEZI|nr:hypothetical protein B0H66DRAFT_640050 [Apodospora peruviana]